MDFVDTHCHIQSAGLSGGERQTSDLWAKAPDLTREQIISSANESGVTRFISVGCDLADSRLAIDLASDQANCWASIGIHPHEASKYLDNASDLSHFSSLADNLKVVAIGECGLDYFYSHSPREAQLEILKFQMELALEHDLPMIFHVREAFDDFWPIFDNYRGIRGVLHSFTDNQANLERAMGSGLFIGVNGIATFAKASAQLAMYKAIPLDRLLLETDAPFLTPVPYRGTINEPKYVRTIAEFLSQLRGESLETLAAQTTTNANTLFRLEG